MSEETKKASECKRELILPWADDVALMGPDRPRDNGQIEHLIQYLVTVRARILDKNLAAHISLEHDTYHIQPRALGFQCLRIESRPARTGIGADTGPGEELRIRPVARQRKHIIVFNLLGRLAVDL